MRDMERVQAYLYQRMPHLKVIEFAQDTSTAALAAAALGTEVEPRMVTFLWWWQRAMCVWTPKPCAI